jgi:hypothetical protein
MIPVKEAVSKAVEFAQTVLDPVRASQILLEEVDTGKLDSEEVWLITLSMPKPGAMSALLTAVRDYKTFTINGQTGQVLSMRIRQIAA